MAGDIAGSAVGGGVLMANRWFDQERYVGSSNFNSVAGELSPAKARQLAPDRRVEKGVVSWSASASLQSGDLSNALEKASAAKEKLADIEKMPGMSV